MSAICPSRLVAFGVSQIWDPPVLVLVPAPADTDQCRPQFRITLLEFSSTMSHIEEGIPLIVDEESAPQTSNKRSLTALFAVVILAVIAAVGYVSGQRASSLPSATNLMINKNTITSASLDEFNVGYSASVNNRAEKAKVIGDSIMGPFSYLSGTTMEYTAPDSEWYVCLNLYIHVLMNIS